MISDFLFFFKGGGEKGYTGNHNMSRMARLPTTGATGRYLSASSTVSLMVATDVLVANHMFLLVKSRRSVLLRIRWRLIMKHPSRHCLDSRTISGESIR